MRTLILLGSAVFLPAILSAQECGTGRYSTYNYFTQIDSIPAVEFGVNTGVDGTVQTLRMDIYAPANDALPERPVVLVSFGGSFVTGSRADVGPFCAELARMGYVAVAMDYRVGFFFPNTSTVMHAVQRCVHDMRGCIRFLRKTVAEDGNPYHIDPDRIIAGGVSAVAIGALHLTYMNEPSELPAPLVADSTLLGGMEGTSGPSGYSSDVMACFSLSGALMDTTWIHPGDQPYCGIHETGDPTVPCYTQQAYAFGFPTGIVVSGDHDVQRRMAHMGVPNCYLEYNAAQHVGYLLYDPVNSVDFVIQFLSRVVCGEASGCSAVVMNIAENEPGAANLGLHPVPTSGPLTLEMPAAGKISIIDARGSVVMRRTLPAGKNVMDVRELPNGLYTLRTEGAVPGTARIVISR